jgi:PelA/Pel-15E family pectate lyase
LCRIFTGTTEEQCGDTPVASAQKQILEEIMKAITYLSHNRLIIIFALYLSTLIGGCVELKPRTKTPPPETPAHVTVKAYHAVSLSGFDDAIHHWTNRYGDNYARYNMAQIAEIADNVLLYQRDNGGWIENRDPTRVLSELERLGLLEEKSNPKGSFDNRNVYSQIEYLSAVYQQTHDERYRFAAMKGLAYTLSMQNQRCGGWPHTVPGSETYHPYITIADDATSGVLRMLRKMRDGNAPFEFMDATTRAAAGESLSLGDACVLQLQVRQNGKLTGWAGQYHPETLQPAQGRSFELPAIVSQESVEMVRYLMSISNPSPDVVQSIEGAVSWLQRSRLDGLKLETFTLAVPIKYEYHTSSTDCRLVAAPSAAPLWGRFYDLQDNSVVLANRDGKRVAQYSDITHERRTGYGWYGDWPAKLLDTEYPAWRERMKR